MHISFNGRTLSLDTPKIMGILNVTPDSFSDGGNFNKLDNALAHAREMVEDGASIIDIGGESTRPGAAPVSLDEELSRVIPAVEAISKNLDVMISIDTSQPQVMKEAVAAGAHIWNDIRALRLDGAIQMAANLQVPVILMHMQGDPVTMQVNPHYDDVVSEVYNFLIARCDDAIDAGIKKENIRLRDHSKEELSHYSNATTDIEFTFPFGWGELWGIASRTDFDLSRHMEHSKQDLSYLDPETNEKYIPYVIEPSLGADRVLLAFLCNSYDEEEIAEGDVRTVLHLHPALAPYKAAVLPLSKKLSEKANEVYDKLSKNFMCDYDEAGSIGKRYRRQDEIGTPYCITVDFDTLEDESVTIRDRDSMEQVRVKIDELENWLNEKIEF